MKRLIILLLIVGCVFAQTTADVMANHYRDIILIDWSEKDFKQYFDSNINNLDPIEGIWRRSSDEIHFEYYDGKLKSTQEKYISGEYMFAVIRDTTNESIFDIFNGYILFDKNTLDKMGTLKVKYKRFREGFYEEQWQMKVVADGSKTLQNAKVNSVDIIMETDYFFQVSRETSSIYGRSKIATNSQCLKIYPDDNSYNTSNNKKTNSSGSGFLLSQTGLVATNYHVIKGGTEIKVLFPIQNQTFLANVKLKDESNDIAILQIENFEYNLISDLDIPYSFSNATQLKAGQDVYTIGYPLGDIMGKSPRSSYGTVSSLYGINDDPRLIQISNPIQPGNSGGGLFNLQGELVGIVVSSLNAQYFYENVGVIPQNVNFAIKVNILRNILGMIPNGGKIIDRKSSMLYLSKEDQNERLEDFIVQIISSNP